MSASLSDPRPVRKSRRWVWFFVLLGLLGCVAVVVPILYNLSQQLQPEQLEAARRLWAEQGPADYDLTFEVTRDRDPQPERHIVLVRDGRVIHASCEGEMVYLLDTARVAIGLPIGGIRQGRGRDVPALFERIESLLAEHSREGVRNFLVAEFDPKMGWPRRFIRRVRGTSMREEWRVRLWPAGALEQPR